MSKRNALRSIAVLSLLVGSAAYAGDPGFYAGVGIGQSNLKADNTSFDESDTAFKLFGGYSLNDNFAIEAAYFDGGSPTKQVTGTANVKVAVDGFNVSAVGRIPLGEQFALFGKLGVAFYNWKVSSNVVSYSVSDNDQDLSYGVGGSFKFTDKFEMRAEYEAVDVKDGDFSVWSVSGVFKF